MNRFSHFLMISTVLLIAGAQWRCGNMKGENSAAPKPGRTVDVLTVRAKSVERMDWVTLVPISGNLRSLSMVDVKPEVGGRLVAVYFQEGDMVQKDQLLGEIDRENYQLSYDQAAAAVSVAQAGVERAQVSAEHAKTEKERADNLLRSGGITEKDHQAASTGVKEALSQVRLAEAQYQQARAALAIAQKALKDCKIFAPAAGQVQKRYFDKGSLLAPGVPFCMLVDNSRLELECVIPSYQLASVRVGQRAAFTTPTWGERLFEGIVSAINPVVESETRSVTVKLKISNPGGELRSGMYARGDITTGREKGALVIPRDSLIPEKEGSQAAGVFVIKEGKAHRIGVQIGDMRQENVWIRQGLTGDEIVITEIGPSLKEGIPVREIQ